jgi:predicted MFS family arabinose efflux permease
MADHFDRRAVLAGCTAVSAALVIGLPLLPATSPAVLGVLMLWGGVSFAIYPVGLALLGKQLTGGDIARGNTAFSLLYILGGLVGRPVTGAAMDLFGEVGFGWTNAIFYIACCLWALLALRRPGR